MEKLKFFLTSVFVLGVLGVAFYWAVLNIESGEEHISSQKLKTLEKENEELRKRTEKLENEIFADASKEAEETKEEVKEEAEEVVVYKQQVLISEIEKLISEKVVLKSKMRGERVGTLQKFLNLYNNRTTRPDNDFGATTERLVKEFQKKEGLKETGEVGVLEFNKMVEWLKKQG